MRKASVDGRVSSLKLTEVVIYLRSQFRNPTSEITEVKVGTVSNLDLVSFKFNSEGLWTAARMYKLDSKIQSFEPVTENILKF